MELRAICVRHRLLPQQPLPVFPPDRTMSILTARGFRFVGRCRSLTSTPDDLSGPRDRSFVTSSASCADSFLRLLVWLAAIILGRDVGLAISAIYYRWISLPPPKTFTRYWDFSLPSAEVRPTTISKYNTFLQLALMGATTVAPLVTGIEVRPALVGLQ